MAPSCRRNNPLARTYNLGSCNGKPREVNPGNYELKVIWAYSGIWIVGREEGRKERGREKERERDRDTSKKVEEFGNVGTSSLNGVKGEKFPNEESDTCHLSEKGMEGYISECLEDTGNCCWAVVGCTAACS